MMTDQKEAKLTALIREWVLSTEGGFTYDQLDRELVILSAQAKNHRRIIIHRLKDEGLIIKDGSKAGSYRRAEMDAPEIDWRGADVEDALDLILPFGMHELLYILPKNLIVIAGAPDSGKSAWCFNFIKHNMKHFPISYFSSEMGGLELQMRLSKFNTIAPSEWTFEARERSSNFADVVRPDGVNVIDYLEVTEEFYKVGGQILEIHNKLRKGIAVVCIQKKRGADLGRGAEGSLEKARLYISMDSNKAKIIKAKNWKNPLDNPVGRAWAFKLVGGCKFTSIQPVYD